jgi:chromosome partitioning protein
LAAILSESAPTLLIDGDGNRSSLAYSKRGPGLPFKVADEKAAARYAGDYPNKIIDTEAHPSKSDLAALAEGCDQLIVIAEPETMSLDVLPAMLDDLAKLGSEKHRVLLCQVSPRSEAADAKAFLEQLNAPTFHHHIRAYAAYKLAALRGVTVNQVHDDYAQEAWSDYLAISTELL